MGNKNVGFSLTLDASGHNIHRRDPIESATVPVREYPCHFLAGSHELPEAMGNVTRCQELGDLPKQMSLLSG